MNRKPGDWDCRSCHHLNFSRRDSCQRCGNPRPRSGGALGFSTGADDRPGDWYCSCGAHNFASRSSCFRCNAFKDDSAVNWRQRQRQQAGIRFQQRRRGPCRVEVW